MPAKRIAGSRRGIGCRSEALHAAPILHEPATVFSIERRVRRYCSWKVPHLRHIRAASLQGGIQRGEPPQRGSNDPAGAQRLHPKVCGFVKLAALGRYQAKVNVGDGKARRPPDHAVPVDGSGDHVAGVLLGPVGHTQQGVAGRGIEGELRWIETK